MHLFSHNIYIDSEKSTFRQININIGEILDLMKTLSGHYVTVIDGLMEIETSVDAKFKLNYI